MTHRCEPGWDTTGWIDRRVFLSGAHGAAIEYCYEDDHGQLWCTNYEYSTRVNFCPFCGYAAPKLVDWKPPDVKGEPR